MRNHQPVLHVRNILGPCFLLAAASAACVAGTETQTIAFDYDVFGEWQNPSFQGFDTQGGTRQLVQVTFAFDHSTDMVVTLENASPFAVTADMYTYEYFFGVILQFGSGEAPPFFGAGGFYSGDVSRDLPQGNGEGGGPGFPPIGGAGNEVWKSDVLTNSLSLSQTYDKISGPEVLQAVTGVGEVPTVLGGFGEYLFFWDADVGPDGLIFAGADSLRHYGTFTVSYEYVDVTPPTCPADFNEDGSINVQDLLAYLSAFRARAPKADFDASGAINVQDLLAYLSAFRARC